MMLVKKITGRVTELDAEVHNIVGEHYRIDMEGKTKETMIFGYSRAVKRARELVNNPQCKVCQSKKRLVPMGDSGYTCTECYVNGKDIDRDKVEIIDL